MAMAAMCSTELASPTCTTPRSSMSRSGSMVCKQVQGLSMDQVKEALTGLLADDTDFVLENIIKPLTPTLDDYKKVAELMNENMDRGLARETCQTAPVAMSPTYVRDVPNGTESGKSLALDFGSHHLRLELISLDKGKCEIDSKNGFVPETLLTSGTAEQLFDYLAKFLYRFLKDRKLLDTPEPLPLGFTFAFPCQRLALNRAILTRWTKALHCEGVEGHEVVALLETAINKKGEMNIICDAIVNDTVGTLLSGSLEDPTCAIGLILSKGTNACYLEQLEKVSKWDGDTEKPLQVVIDTEWGMLGSDGCLDFVRSKYDHDIDKHSKHPGKAIFEKMQSAQYMGEQVRLILEQLKQEEILFQDHWTHELDTRNRFYTKYISEVLSEEDIRFVNTRHVMEDFHVKASELECRVLHHICNLVTTRAATLAAIGLACLIDRIDQEEVGIAVDGALYRYHPTFKYIVEEKIPLFLKHETRKFKFVPARDGSGRGAALAAAVAERIKRDKAAPAPDTSDITDTTNTETVQAMQQDTPTEGVAKESDSKSVDVSSKMETDEKAASK